MDTETRFLASITEHQKIIHKVCNMYMNNEQDKKDLFQEVVLGAWKGFQHFKGEAKFSTWLYRVALNTAITFYRKEKNKLKTAVLTEEYAHAVTDFPLQEDEQLNAMYRSIAALSDIDKALVMLYLDDYHYNDIGDIMGISANNVAVKMNRIKARLRDNSKKYL